jgi:cyanophycinase-like exopeptidase
MKRTIALALSLGLLVATGAARAQNYTPEPPVATPASCTPIVYRPDGTPEKTHVLRGPGLLLEGSGAQGSPVAGLRWLRAHMGASQTGRAGNVVVVRASSERDYTDDFYAQGRFAWVEEILIPPCATRAQVDAMARYVDMADAVYFAGGDQSNYARWKGSKLIAAVQRVYARKGFVGGGSAGLAIQGDLGYDSVAANRLHPGDDGYEVKSFAAAADPLMPEISFTHLFSWPPLRHTITDTHFKARDRFGRLVAFIARIVNDPRGTTPYYGIGIDQGSEVSVEPNGTAILRVDGKSGGAILIRGGPVTLVRGKPLHYTVWIAHLSKDGTRFDLLHHRPGVAWTQVRVSGGATPVYSKDPFAP